MMPRNRKRFVREVVITKSKELSSMKARKGDMEQCTRNVLPQKATNDKQCHIVDKKIFLNAMQEKPPFFKSGYVLHRKVF